MKNIYQIISILFTGLNLYGQTVWIDSLYIEPQSPTTADTIIVVAEIRTASAGCELKSKETEIDETNKLIKITGCYAIGPMDTICPSRDTFFSGLLQEGKYKIILTVKGFETIVNPNGDCTIGNEVSKETEIFISEINSTENKQLQQSQFELVTNPVNEYAFFRINPEATEIKIVIIDHLGRIVTKEKISNNHGQELKIEVKQLIPGIYYCYLERKGGISKAIKMIKE